MRILLDMMKADGLTMAEVTKRVEYLMKIGTFAQGFGCILLCNMTPSFGGYNRKKTDSVI